MAHRLCRAVFNLLEASSARWEGLRQQLAALNPAAVLGRGFALARTPAGEIVRNARQVAVGDSLELILSSGLLGCRVETVQKNGRNK